MEKKLGKEISSDRGPLDKHKYKFIIEGYQIFPMILGK